MVIPCHTLYAMEHDHRDHRDHRDMALMALCLASYGQLVASKVRGSPRPEDSRAKQRRVPSQSSGAYGKKYRAMREARQSTEIKTYHFRE